VARATEEYESGRVLTGRSTGFVFFCGAYVIGT
jgi:hypothetical protein